MPTKVLFLGIDAGDKFLIQDWAADGTLPTLKSLLAQGLVGDTMSLRGFFVGSTWPSFFTGLNPAHHGFYSLVALAPGTYNFCRGRASNFINGEPFWNFLSNAGKRVAVLDVPLSGITPHLNGMQIVEWGSHDANYGFSTWPPRLKWDVWARFGRHPLRTSCDYANSQPPNFRSLADLLIEGIRKKTQLTKHYLKKDNWDFFAQVFTEAHCIGHQCWHLHDPKHPNFDKQTSSLTADPVRKVYQALDAALAEILGEVDADTIVFIMASHRMAHFYGAHFLLPEILERLQLIKQTAPATASEAGHRTTKLYDCLKWMVKNSPPNLMEVLKQVFYQQIYLLQDYHAKHLPINLSVDPKKSSCFILHNGHPVSGLRVNLSGREPEGTISPGREMDSYCNQLADDLMKMVEYDSGKPIVKAVIRTAELYQGEYLDCLPDLLVEWSDDIMVESESSGNPKGRRLQIFSEKTGIIEGYNSYCRTGDHRPEGLFLVLGPQITASHLDATVSIMDFAPTICKLLGVELNNVDGQPIREIFSNLA